MKHFTLLFAAAMMAVSAFAGNPVAKHLKEGRALAQSSVAARHQTAATFSFDAPRGTEILSQAGSLRAKTQAGSLRASRAESDLITEVEGRKQNYMSYATGFLIYFGQLYFDQSQGMTEVVWGDNGQVYIKDFLRIGLDTYVKGDYADGKITIQLPQLILSEEEDGELFECWLNMVDIELTEDNYINAPNVTENNVIEITVNDDGTMLMTTDPDYEYTGDPYDLPARVVGVVSDPTPGEDKWLGFGDAIQEYEEWSEEVVTPPADAVVEKWAYVYDDEDGTSCVMMVKVAVSGSDIYIGNLDEEVPNGWAKGTIDGRTAKFPTGQYLGYSNLYSIPVYFIAGEFTEVYYEEWDFWDFHVEFMDDIIFDYDIKHKTLKASKVNSCIVTNAYLDELLFLRIMVNPEFKWQSPELVNAAPLNPECINYVAWDPDYYSGQGEIVWNIPFYNVNGAILDTDQMYYNFYADGELYGLDPEEYPNIEEYMEDIPYNFNDGEDIWAVGEEHDIYFYFDGATSFGLQSFYVADDGTVYGSELVTYVPEGGESGISDASYIKVESTKYFDLAGREVANPVHGLYIKQMKLADGSVRNVKTMVK